MRDDAALTFVNSCSCSSPACNGVDRPESRDWRIPNTSRVDDGMGSALRINDNAGPGELNNLGCR